MAETGSGKTLAFGLPLLVRVAAARSVATSSAARSRRSRPLALVLVPTRELARQVHDELAPLARALGLRMLAVYGGAPMRTQVQALRGGVEVVVATPGRLTDLLGQGACSLDAITVTVLDEADHMADMGFLPAVTWLLDRIPAAGRVLLFVRTKRGAARLARQLKSAAGVPVGALHGDMAQHARERALAAFVSGRTPVLVATDVAARGIHVDGVDLVVHFDPPTEPKA